MIRSLVRSTLAVSLLVLTAAPAAEAAKYLRANKPIRGRYIVTFKDSVPADKVELHAKGLAKQHGGKVIATMKHAMKGFGVVMNEHRARALMHNPLVEMVEEDGEMFLSSEPIRPEFTMNREIAPKPAKVKRPSLSLMPMANLCGWNAGGYYVCEYTDDTYWVLDRLDNVGPLYGYKAYAYNSTGAGVRAYVVDSGVWYGHYELQGRVEEGANMTVDPDVYEEPDDPNHPNEEPAIPADYSPADDPCNKTEEEDEELWGYTTHGTSVASLIGGTTTGVAKDVTIIPVKVISCINADSSKLAVARGLDWIQNDMSSRSGRAVVNMSMFAHSTGADGSHECEDGQGGYTNCVSAIENEVSNLVDQDIVFVTSANNHNNGNCTTVPARMGYGGTFAATDRPITVGASTYVNNSGTYSDARYNLSNYGPCVSIWAPGARLLIATTRGATDYYNQTAGGSSYASAITTGIVARLLEEYPTLSSVGVWNALVSRANNRYSVPDFDPLTTHTNTKLVYISHAE